MKKLKKLLCMMIAILMMASLAAVCVNAEAVDYDDAEDGDLLYELNFNGDEGFAPVDGRHSNWNSTDAQVSADGKSVTVTYTGKNEDEPDGKSKSRARFAGVLEDYTVPGKSYTVEFTVQSDVRVGIMLDGGCGFVVNPKSKYTWIGAYGDWTKIATYESYKGYGSDSNTDTYAIEISFGDQMSKDNEGHDCYAPEVYRLYVKDTNGKWTLIRELEPYQAEFFDWEISGGVEYFELDFAIVRYNAEQTNTEGSPTLSTVSDVKLYKGINFIEVNEIEEEEPEEEEEEQEQEQENNGSGNNGASNNAGNNSKPAPTPVETDAPETEAKPEAKVGCGASIAMSGVALVSACAAMVAIKCKKKDEE